MSNRISLWKRISDIGTKHIPESEKRSVIFLNRINYFIIILSLLGFIGTILVYCVIQGGKPGIGALRLLLMLISGLFSLTLTSFGRNFSAKIVTSVVPVFLLVVLPTVLGDVAIEYYYYYPSAGTASAMIPLLLFPRKGDRTVLYILIFFCFLITVTSDILLSFYSESGKIPEIFRDRYFFYKLAQILLFLFVIPTVYTLRELNFKFESILIEQNDRLSAQTEELTSQSEELTGLNEELSLANTYLASSNKELENYKNKLEDLVELRTLALTDSEARFRNIFENANDAIFILRDEFCIDCNLKAHEIFGYPKDQILGKSAYALSPEKQYDGSNSKLLALKKIEAVFNGEGQRFEWLYRKSDGSLFDAEVSLNTIKFREQIFLLAMVRDITVRKRAEESLKESENNFRNIFEKSVHAIVIIDLKTKLLLANRAFYETTGYSSNGDGPAYATDIILKEYHSLMTERIERLFTGNTLPPVEYKARFNDGKVHIIEVTSSSMNFYGEKACLAIIRDITDVKEAEHRVMEAIINSEENERSRIAQDLHDGLGPVLSTIKLYFQVYRDTSNEAKKAVLAEKLTGTIQEAIREISEISHNISPHVFRNYGFYAALKQFVHRIDLTNVVDIKLDCTNEPELTQNSGIMLYRAICELINNSIKHAACKKISLLIHKEGDFIIADYSDDGKGFNIASVSGTNVKGSGLVNIRNRLNALKGSADFSSSIDLGMHACLKIPV